MRYAIENEQLKVEVESLGAELKSMLDKQTKVDYMWCADPAYYKRTSPNLFPIVGSLKDGKYTYNGKEYAMSQHGFARDYEWKAVKKSDTEISFFLASTEETLEKYPFAFELELRYVLSGRDLTVTWFVKNPSDQKMYFSCGGHPCFTCPIHGEADKSGYGYNFHMDGDVTYTALDLPTGTMLPEEHTLHLENGKAAFTPEFFDKGAYIVAGGQTKKVSLYDPSGEDYLTVSFDAPLFGLWSAEGRNAPYAAIEPWYGRCDRVDFDGTLEDREWGNELEAGKTFEGSYTISVK